MATPTTDPFKSCKLKLKRASEHNQTLYKELSAWYKSDPYRLIKEYDPETRRHVSIFELDSEKRPNLERWSLVSADCVHNLRTALDHAAYAIAAVKTGQNPPPCWDKVKFPIADADHKFREAMNRYGLSFLQESDLAMWAAIESFQPYKRPNALNARLPPFLSLIRDLENGDKHRLLRLAVEQLQSVEIDKLQLDVGTDITDVRVHTGQLKDRTEIFSFTTSKPTPDVKYQTGVHLVICFRQGPPVEVASLNGWVVEEVEKVIDFLIHVL